MKFEIIWTKGKEGEIIKKDEAESLLLALDECPRKFNEKYHDYYKDADHVRIELQGDVVFSQAKEDMEPMIDYLLPKIDGIPLEIHRWGKGGEIKHIEWKGFQKDQREKLKKLYIEQNAAENEGYVTLEGITAFCCGYDNFCLYCKNAKWIGSGPMDGIEYELTCPEDPCGCKSFEEGVK